MNRTYDIIIPVYNGYNFVKECYESILKNTSDQHFIVFVDDASTEPALLEYYQTIESHPNTIIIHQPENKGFIHSVNTGMNYSQNQIILLNSDTTVTKDWIEKIDTALFSSVAVGTATPWTNNGTICSFPDFCRDNDLPDHITPDQLSIFAEKTCDDFYPTLPTAVGFCMAIKRGLVDEIGLFNEQAFGRGYGEENDFCMRAHYAGYLNILDNRTFIYHKGSLTFQGEKQQQLEINLAKVGEMHPDYFPMVEKFVAQDPLKLHRKRIKCLVEAQAEKLPHILFLLHNDPLGDGINPVGGTEYHVLQLAEYLNKNNLARASILVCSDTFLSLLDPGKNGWRISKQNLTSKIYFNSKLNLQYKTFLDEILYTHHIDIIHIQHLFHHPHNLSIYLEDWKGSIFFTLHDYYLLCPSHNLMDDKGLYCDGGSLKQCTDCMNTLMAAQNLSHIKIDVQNYWRPIQLDNLTLADRIFVPSQSAAEVLTKTIPKLRSKLIVRPHGSNNNSTIETSHVMQSPLNIAFLGGLSKVKGSQFITQLLTDQRSPEFNWFLIGDIGDPELEKIDLPHIKKFGRYKQDQLPNILEDSQIDLIVLCSVWPETFSYTLSEAWLANTPVIVGPFGAPAERVAESKAGWILDELLPKKFFQLVDFIKSDPNEYSDKAGKAQDIQITSVAEMSMLYYNDYIETLDIKKMPLYRKRIEPLTWSEAELNPEGIHYNSNRNLSFLAQKNIMLQNKITVTLQNNITLQNKITLMLTSKSWKITRPLRYIIRLLSRLRA